MNLKSLSDQEILKGTEDLAREERKILSELLLWLREVDDRKLYCDLKCGSLFQYCVKVLHYSEPSAQRRVDAMRLSRDIPGVCEKVSSGELSLSVAAQAQSFFRKEKKFNLEQKSEILETLTNKSYRESERELLSLSSQPEIHIPEKVRPVSPTHSQIQFVATDEQLALFEKARGLLANSNPEITWAELFAKVTEIALQKIDPAQRGVSPARKSQNEDTRRVGITLKRILHQRDDGKCRNCGSIFRLEGDHIQSWAKNGKTTEQNLQLLCHACNQRKAIREFGLNRDH